jgi:hypothetical protein
MEFGLPRFDCTKYDGSRISGAAGTLRRSPALLFEAVASPNNYN